MVCLGRPRLCGSYRAVVAPDHGSGFGVSPSGRTQAAGLAGRRARPCRTIVAAKFALARRKNGRVGQIFVKVTDKVFEGEALVRIDNDEVQTHFAKIQGEVNLRKRGRDNPPLPKDAPRRHVEVAAAESEQAVVDARSAPDRSATARRAGTGSEDTLKAASVALSTARAQLQQRQDELSRFEVGTPSTVPTELEGQLAAARSDLRSAQAALDNLTIRAPLAGTVLQLGARMGELASPSALQPLLVLGDLTALRVRAELNERDYGTIKTGQPVVVRSDAFPDRDFIGKVSSIAPIIAPGKFRARGPSNSDIDVLEGGRTIGTGSPDRRDGGRCVFPSQTISDSARNS